jgi:pimeloyl-ACP methyl ester carboxylesterase
MTTSHLIERAFVSLPGRQVHYRRAGSGPPVVLLHQSPTNSLEFEPLMTMLAADFTVIAPDTPGYGLSDPVVAADSDPEIDVFADAVAAFFDAMGLERAGIYGFHTGALIATRFAARYPGRVSALVANGLLIGTAEERADLLAHYLPQFTPSWDGGHLSWAWARLREQLVFFPWYRRDPTARVGFPVTLDRLQAAAHAFLLAGDNYRAAYHAALSYNPIVDLPRLAPPARFVCAVGDPLFHYLDRFPTLPENAAIERVADAGAAESFLHDFLLQHPAAPWPGAPEASPAARRISSQMVVSGGQHTHVRFNRDSAGLPVVVLHDIGRSSRTLQTLIGGFVGTRPVYAPDLLGHGDSDPIDAGERDIVGALAAALGATLDGLGLAEVDLIATGFSAPVALDLARRDGSRIASLSICNPVRAPAERVDEFRRRYAPSLTPEWGGGHLLTAWHCARDQDLFWPWFDKSPAAALPAGMPPAPAANQLRTIDLLKAGPALARIVSAAVRYPVAERMRVCRAPLSLFRAPAAPVDPAFAEIGPNHELPALDMDWAATLLASLDS